MERRATTAKGKRRNPQGRGAGAKERRVQGGTLRQRVQGGGLAWVGSEGRGQKARVKPLGRRSEGGGAGARVRPPRVWSKGLGARAAGEGQVPEGAV